MAASSSSDRVSQPKLADALGLTPRRVRQLVKEHILPEADDDGCYDLDRCQRFYDLYQRPSDAAWRAFFDELEDQAFRVERLVRRAAGDGAMRADLAKAGPALVQLIEALQFAIAVKSTSDAERTFMTTIFNRLVGDAFAGLLHRTFHLAGADLGLSTAEVEEQFANLRVAS